MTGHFPEHDPGAVGKREAGNAGTDGGKCDGPEFPFGGDFAGYAR